MDVKFYMCLTCGNIICKVVDSGVTPECCGSEMVLLEPKSVDSGLEKHLPVVERLDACTLKVRVGAAPHPCIRDHHIVMLALKTRDGLDIKLLDNRDCCSPKATFACFIGQARGVYAYCNLHGLLVFADR